MEPSWLPLASEMTGGPIMLDGFLDYYEDRLKDIHAKNS
jgi:hypothetical protein